MDAKSLVHQKPLWRLTPSECKILIDNIEAVNIKIN